ncbi:hypothetical protein PFISCL1PPCAC_22141, partial [Pristionchus fissidentatus]
TIVRVVGEADEGAAFAQHEHLLRTIVHPSSGDTCYALVARLDEGGGERLPVDELSCGLRVEKILQIQEDGIVELLLIQSHTV